MNEARVTVHMAASLDGFIAREDGQVDWMETHDSFEAGESLAPEDVQRFLGAIDCYVMGARTYLTALAFEAKGFGWAYGDTPVFVFTSRVLEKPKPSVRFASGELRLFFEEQLKPVFRNIWIVGGARLAGACLEAGLVDEVRYSILPVVIGKGLSFFDGLSTDVALHLCEARAYRNGVVALRYQVERRAEEPQPPA